MNERCLRFADVRLIAADGAQVGIIQTRKALEMSREAGLDLVIVAGNVHPPVARIVDYGKYKYELDKKKKTSKERAKTQDVKGIKLRPGIALGDLQIALKKIHAWIADGDKVKVQVQFRAREITHPEVGRQKLNWILERVSSDVAVERQPSLDGNLMTMVLIPNKVKPASGAKSEQAKDKQDSQQAVQD
ncbi:MAG: translation initiation factor IF-3 [Fimbriimonadales bacterium]